MEQWQRWLDDKLREVIGDGNVAHLPGAGKPLILEDEDNIPEELRVAYRIMRDNHMVPDWVMLGAELERDRKAIHQKAAAYARSYTERLRDAWSAGSFVMERDAEERWQAACAKLRDLIDAYNSKLLTYNVQIPPEVVQGVPINADDLLATALARFR